ncbi:MAG: hypothetical protein J6Q68_05445 [Clostridia bacterium]|nr:hypothetical protein [Clostridia bacterium]
MKNLVILVKMQLKERLNFKRSALRDVGLFKILLSILGAALKFALTVALSAAFLLVFSAVVFSGGKVPLGVISIVFWVMLFASLVSCVVGITKSLYYARDNAILLTLPCRPIQVYASKLIIFFFFEVKKNFAFLVPFFIAFYITHGYGVGAYIWMLFCILWISLFTVAAASLLSIPTMWISSFFRQRRWLQLSSIAVGVAVISVALFFAISMIPEDIDLLANWPAISQEISIFLLDPIAGMPESDIILGKFSYPVDMAPLYNMSKLFHGEKLNYIAVGFKVLPTALRFITLVLMSAALIALSLVIVRPMYYKMASKPFEYLKKQVKPKHNKVRGRRYASIYHGYLVAFKSTDRMILNIGVLISVPMLIFLLNKIFLAMNTREFGNNMIVAFNILIILLVVLNANCYASSIFSRDGRSAYLIKTQPSKYPILIITRLLPNTSFVAASLIATLVILLISLPASAADIVLMIVAIAMAYLAHMLYCAELDLMNPQNELYATVGNNENNPNETKATISAFIISFFLAGGMFLLLIESSQSNAYLKLALVALGALIYRGWLFFAKIRLYYKEK